MGGKAFFALIVAALFMLPSCLYGRITDDEKMTESAGNAYSISSNIYEEKEVKILYPSILGLSDLEKQSSINELLKENAFRELTDYLDGGIALEDIRVAIEYEVSYQNNRYLCVIYTGIYNAGGSARNFFEAITIDISNGNRLRLSDMARIDYDFVELVKNTLRSHIEKNPEWEVVYLNKLDRSDDDFLDMFWAVDAGKSLDFCIFFTKESVGFSFAASRIEGHHFEVEMPYENVRGYLAIALP